MIDIHVFRYSSSLGTRARAYAVIRQPFETKHVLVASKTRLSQKPLTIPRLELVAAQMVANLASNIRNSFANYKIRDKFSEKKKSEINYKFYGWSDIKVGLQLLTRQCKLQAVFS